MIERESGKRVGLGGTQSNLRAARSAVELEVLRKRGAVVMRPSVVGEVDKVGRLTVQIEADYINNDGHLAVLKSTTSALKR